MPDLNSLPPSQTPSSRSSPTSYHRPSLSPQMPSPLSRSPTNTAAAPTAPLSNSPRPPRSPHIERRRSSLLRDWSLNDGNGSATSPSGDPLPHTAYTYHHRAPSLGELHQELENEQEAQVNRLLAMIRQQQAQIQQSQSQLQAQQAQSQSQAQHASSALDATASAAAVADTGASGSATASTTAVASSTPASSRSHSLALQQQQSTGGAMPPPTTTAVPRSRTNSHSQYSHASSPTLRPHDAADWVLPGLGGGGRERDEVAFYQAETAMVQRENQMLKGRIRELERMLQGTRVGAQGVGADDAGSTQG